MRASERAIKGEIRARSVAVYEYDKKNSILFRNSFSKNVVYSQPYIRSNCEMEGMGSSFGFKKPLKTYE